MATSGSESDEDSASESLDTVTGEETRAFVSGQADGDGLSFLLEPLLTDAEIAKARGVSRAGCRSPGSCPALEPGVRS